MKGINRKNFASAFGGGPRCHGGCAPSQPRSSSRELAAARSSPVQVWRSHSPSMGLRRRQNCLNPQSPMLGAVRTSHHSEHKFKPEIRPRARARTQLEVIETPKINFVSGNNSDSPHQVGTGYQPILLQVERRNHSGGETTGGATHPAKAAQVGAHQ